MAKKHMVIFGDNYTGAAINGLNGCIADAMFWRQYAQQKQFDSVNLLTDAMCTKNAMVKALNDGLALCQLGDLFVEIYSGHGTYVPSNRQSLVPYDFNFDNPSSWITYDELDQIFMPHEARGVKVVAVHDSCHSAANPALNWRQLVAHPTSNRFLQPPQHILDRMVGESVNKSVLSSAKGALLLSGCGKSQTSADAFIDGAYHGAFTYSLQLALTQNVQSTYHDALLASRAWLAQNRYDQVPGLDGTDALKLLAFFEA